MSNCYCPLKIHLLPNCIQNHPIFLQGEGGYSQTACSLIILQSKGALMAYQCWLVISMKGKHTFSTNGTSFPCLAKTFKSSMIKGRQLCFLLMFSTCKTIYNYTIVTYDLQESSLVFEQTVYLLAVCKHFPSSQASILTEKAWKKAGQELPVDKANTMTQEKTAIVWIRISESTKP